MKPRAYRWWESDTGKRLESLFLKSTIQVNKDICDTENCAGHTPREEGAEGAEGGDDDRRSLSRSRRVLLCGGSRPLGDGSRCHVGRLVWSASRIHAGRDLSRGHVAAWYSTNRLRKISICKTASNYVFCKGYICFHDSVSKIAMAEACSAFSFL